MIYVIRKEETVDINPCICGEYPKFIVPDMNYTDCWLQCPKCGRRTYNAGGCDFGYEIPLSSAKSTATEWWNSNINIR